MHYTSTRGTPAALSFDDVVLAGLAPDGGLYLPQSLPHFSHAELEDMRRLSYTQLAARIMLPFMGEGWNEARLMPLLEKSYSHQGAQPAFRHPGIAPLVALNPQHHVLELFHGPTLAFKDFALQFLGHLLEDILKRQHREITVVGATSGDTGSAAIAGLAGHTGINIHILFPHGRVSDVQRRQMTTIAAPNVHALAIEGTFDDCQNMVKTMFADASFNQRHHLVAVNSINWARIMAQIVYYFYAALQLGAPQTQVHFSVPTGNFGDIYAGWLAKQMGLGTGKLIIATNANDILTRCWQHGLYDMKDVIQTLSPSMDIQISSNFERLLYGYVGRDASALLALMNQLKSSRSFTLPAAAKARFAEEFHACAVDDAKTLTTMRRIHETHGMVIDPHTATGIHASELFASSHPGEMLVSLATAHPAKFPEAVHRATGICPALPEHLKNLFDLPEKSVTLPHAIDDVKRYIDNHRVTH